MNQQASTPAAHHRTEEMMQPCLIDLYVVSLVPLPQPALKRWPCLERQFNGSLILGSEISPHKRAGAAAERQSSSAAAAERQWKVESETAADRPESSELAAKGQMNEVQRSGHAVEGHGKAVERQWKGTERQWKGRVATA